MKNDSPQHAACLSIKRDAPIILSDDMGALISCVYIPLYTLGNTLIKTLMS